MEKNKYQHLGYKTYLLFALKNSFTMFFFLLCFCLFLISKSFVTDESWQKTLSLGTIISLSLTFFAILLTFLNAFVEYISFRFMFMDTALKVTKGIFNKKEIMIPYQKIQSIDINQNFFQQIFGICQLVILTAGNLNQPEKINAESGGILPAIDDNVAQEIRDELLRMMQSDPQDNIALKKTY
jgi:uncharacterized membrane protein YdbT with pleckstrin-like domain